jgi:hypothetical protein
MKRYYLLAGAIILLLCYAALLNSCKTTAGHYTQRSYIDPRKTVYYNKDGDHKGYLQESYIDPRRTTQYNRKGNEKGYWQKDYIDPRKTRFYKKK